MSKLFEREDNQAIDITDDAPEETRIQITKGLDHSIMLSFPSMGFTLSSFFSSV